MVACRLSDYQYVIRIANVGYYVVIIYCAVAVLLLCIVLCHYLILCYTLW